MVGTFVFKKSSFCKAASSFLFGFPPQPLLFGFILAAPGTQSPSVTQDHVGQALLSPRSAADHRAPAQEEKLLFNPHQSYGQEPRASQGAPSHRIQGIPVKFQVPLRRLQGRATPTTGTCATRAPPRSPVLLLGPFPSSLGTWIPRRQPLPLPGALKQTTLPTALLKSYIPPATLRGSFMS